MSSMTSKQIFDIKLDKVAQCVVPINNRNEVELQFQESDANKDEDSLVQITFRFPSTNEEDEDVDPDEETKAEYFQRSILDSGVINSATGNVLVEFSKELVIQLLLGTTKKS